MCEPRQDVFDQALLRSPIWTAYAKAPASVVEAWLKERRGRQVRLESGRSKVTANSASDAERLLAALIKHEKEIGLLQAAKAPKKCAKKKAAAKRKKKS